MARSTALVAAAKREQILQAAIRRFARQSYEDTSLRQIAADVGVDVAHVHRSFGSKELLLMEALRATDRPERFLPGSRSRLVAQLSSALFPHRPAAANDEVRSLDIFMRSLTSREASRVLRDAILADFIAPLSMMTSPPSSQRGALIAAFVLGIGVLREVLHIDPLQDDEDGELEKLAARALDTLASGTGKTVGRGDQ